ncbi:MAG: trigger factor [Aquificaceae bacterium]|nr:trigger factor [Aquificaceae bacterium]
MKVSVREKDGLLRELEVELEGPRVRAVFDEVCSDIQKNATLSGFRRGNVPMWVLKARFRERIKEEVGKKLADMTLSDALREGGLVPAADVFLNDIELSGEDRLLYKVSFEVLPKFELADVSSIEIKQKKVEFSEELLNKRIEELRMEKCVFEPSEEELKEGYMAIIEYRVEDVETAEVVEGETSGIVGKKVFRKEVEDVLIGKKEGEDASIDEIEVFDVYGRLSGKAKVSLKIKGVKKPILPEIGDDFAKELGLGESWEEALEKIKDNLIKELEELNKSMAKDALIEELLKLHQFELPQTLVRRELSAMVQRSLEELSYMGVDPKLVSVEEIAKDLLPKAQLSVKLGLILDAYAKSFGLSVSEEELRSLTQGREGLSEALLSTLRASILREKALEKMLSMVKLSEEAG